MKTHLFSIVFGCVMTSGCTVNDGGALIAKATTTNNITNVALYSAGLSLFTRNDATHIGLGLNKNSVSYMTNTIKDGWYVFLAPHPEAQIIRHANTSIGLDLSKNTRNTSISLGYNRELVVGPFPTDGALLVLFKAGDQYEIEQTITCQEGASCLEPQDSQSSTIQNPLAAPLSSP